MRDVNFVVFTGTVSGVFPITGGSIVNVMNRQDYKNKEGEWVDVKHYLSAACFWDVDVALHDEVTVTGTLSTRKDKTDPDGKRSVLSITVAPGDIKNKSKSSSNGGGSSDKSADKPAAAAQKSKPSRKPKDEDEENDLWD